MHTAFHVAPAAARARIARDGLIASAPHPRWQRYDVARQPAGVYVWETFDRAMRWARDFLRLLDGAELGQCDIWAVDVAHMRLRVDPVLGDQGARIVPGSVRAQRVRLLIHAEDLVHA